MPSTPRSPPGSSATSTSSGRGTSTTRSSRIRPRPGRSTLDHLFVAADLEALTLRTYDGLGLDLRAVLARSDLYARDRKSQHAFCIDIDREGDVRVLCNLEPSERWMDTMLHEFGHAIYDRESDRSLPWLVRSPAHSLTTEGIAMLFGRLTRNPEWLVGVAGVDRDTVDALASRLRRARARRPARVRSMGARHDHLRAPALRRSRTRTSTPSGGTSSSGTSKFAVPDGRHEPDWAAKIHLAAAPVYYQNYLYGELFASQLDATLTERVGGLVERPAAGELLVRDVFAPGASVRWDDLVTRATGAPLSAAALARQLAA